LSKSTNGKLILPALTMSRIVPQARNLLTTFLLIEIGQTYGTSIGLTNQIKTFNSIAAVLAALTMGFLSVRYKQRTLLMVGLSLSIISVIGCYSAPSFITLVIMYSLGGVAGNTILPMTTSLLGEHVPREDRTKSLGWLMAGPAALYIVGYPLVNYIDDWRLSFLLFVLPIILVALLLTIIGVPKHQSTPPRTDILAGYKGILSNKSAVACLVSYGLGLGAWQITLSLSTSNLRQQFLISRDVVVWITMLNAMMYIAGALVSRKVVSRYGVKTSSMFLNVLLGVFTICRFIVPDFVLAIVLSAIICVVAGLRSAAVNGLNLEQVPDLRGSMMSLTDAFGSIGNVLSLSLGGYLLIVYNWGIMGSIIGSFGFVAGLFLHMFVKERSKT